MLRIKWRINILLANKKRIVDIEEYILEKRIPRSSILSRGVQNILAIFTYCVAATLIMRLLPQEYRMTGGYYLMVILGAVASAAIAQQCKSKLGYYIFIAISFIILFFTLGFRDLSAIDDAAYARIFNNIYQNGWVEYSKSSGMEIGYLILNSLVSKFTNDYFHMQVLTTFIQLLLFYNAFIRNKDRINLSMAVFLLSTMFYFQMLSVGLMRMCIAIGIVMNAYSYIERKDYKKYIGFILIAGLFHYSSLFMLVLAYLAIDKQNMSKKGKYFLISFFVLTPVVFTIVGRILIPLMGNRYAQYANMGNLKISLSSFDTVPILLLLLFYHKHVSSKNKSYYYLSIVIFTLSSILSFYSSMISLGRLIFYANIGLYIAAPLVSRALRGKQDKMIFDGIIIFYGFIYVYTTQFMLKEHIPYLFPYFNIFFQIG